jgi:hypothetical protein
MEGRTQMAEKQLILGVRCPRDGFKYAVGKYLRHKATVLRDDRSQSASITRVRHENALDALADFIEGLPTDDQRLRAMFEAQVAHVGFDKGYVPVLTYGGSQQEQLISLLGGITGEAPDFNDTLNELVAAAVHDSNGAHSQRLQGLAREREQNEERARKAEQYRAQAEAAKPEITALRAELAEANAELERQRERGDTFKALVDGREQKPAPKRKPKSKAERPEPVAAGSKEA